MNHVVVVLNTNGMSVPQKMAYGNSILQAMQSNPNFQNPSPALGLLQQALDDLAVAINNSVGGGKFATTTMHDKEYQVMRILKALAAHVEFESNDDEVMALSSGFSVRQQAASGPSGFRVKNVTNNGEVLLKTKRITGASYIWQYTSDLTGATGWNTGVVTNNAGYTVTGLTPLQKYLFRVAVVINNTQQPYSESLMLLVL